MRTILGLMTAVALAASGAHAQIDPSAVGQSGVHSSTMRNHADRIARERGGAARPDNSARARAVCAQRMELRAKFGSDDPKIRQIFDLCNRLHY
ncbi:hypothetical protein SAMN06297144_1113 [Sphingomonas guangdongensis]|uniref:Uncharacterized protein n=1 Tax=Sphingomonas guangdongensis TaxID=1141890 RepID=A0A285QKE6_9SPHN|nr:hypothetical protein [Sphingomonas guangdongensis]SOB80542.1 hypothetical protein SAMN06297144_1113 [Sphingomonas guangdongensis]